MLHMINRRKQGYKVFPARINIPIVNRQYVLKSVSNQASGIEE
jgi:hypothetical protein